MARKNYKDRKIYFAEWHLKNKVRRNKEAAERYQNNRSAVLEKQAKRRINKKEQIVAYNAGYYIDNREEILTKQTIYRQENPEVQADYSLRKRYKITLKQKKELLEKQGGCCEGCTNRLLVEKGNKCCVDHDHLTGKIRGILCRECNLALGYAKDNPETLRRLADYLERNK